MQNHFKHNNTNKIFNIVLNTVSIPTQNKESTMTNEVKTKIKVRSYLSMRIECHTK